MTNQEMAFLAQIAIGTFSVDEQGRVWRYRRMVGGSRMSPAYEKYITSRRAETSRASYPTIMFTVNGKRMKVYAHRIVWMVLNRADIPPGFEVNHKDGKKENNHPSNLEILTRKDNTIHSFRELPRKTKEQRGEANASAKLTIQNILEIRRLCREKKISQSKIAEMYGVVQATISAIHLKKSWGHIVEV